MSSVLLNSGLFLKMPGSGIVLVGWIEDDTWDGTGESLYPFRNFLRGSSIQHFNVQPPIFRRCRNSRIAAFPSHPRPVFPVAKVEHNIAGSLCMQSLNFIRWGILLSHRRNSFPDLRRLEYRIMKDLSA